MVDNYLSVGRRGRNDNYLSAGRRVGRRVDNVGRTDGSDGSYTVLYTHKHDTQV